MRIALLLLLCLLVATGSALARNNDAELKTLLEAYEDGVELTRSEYGLLLQANLIGGSSGNIIDHLGGPDAFGYIFRDSDEPDGPVYSWIDITPTGTSVIGDMSDDNTSGPYPIGFTFPFYGATYSNFYIGSNGAINFDGQYISLSNQEMPSTSYQAMIAWFWDDMDPADATDADLLYQTLTIGDQNALVISFLNWDEYPGNVDPNGQEDVTAQMILFEDGSVQIHYMSVETGIDVGGCTVGIQNDAGDIGLTVLHDGSVPSYPFSELAIEFNNLPGDASLHGTVRDAGTFVPVQGATVQVGNLSTTTNIDGYYSFPDLFSGTLPYEVTAIGYETDAGSLTLQPGENARDFMLNNYVADADVLLIDVDETLDSGPQLNTILTDLGYTTYYTNDFFEVPFMGYQCVFLCVGVYPNDFVITTNSAEEQACVDYLNAGGNFYLEGADVYAYASPDNLIGMLNLGNLADGSADLYSVAGDDTLSGLTMSYSGENSYIDHIEPINGARRVLHNPADNGGCGVLDNNEVFNSACFTFELGMLVDNDDYTRTMIIEAVMDNFGVDAIPDLLTLDLVGQVVTIPPNGGTVIYDAIMVSTLPEPTLMDAWTFVTTPNGNVIGPLFDVSYLVIPGTGVEMGLPQSVPAMAPAGVYIYSAYMGDLPDLILASDSFMFTKIGAEPDGGGSWEDETWATVMSQNAESSAVTIPSEYSLETAYPNPFNPTTTISIALPEAADLTVVVYNVTGQLVATLANGQTNAGTHSYVFDASDLASGLYFVRAAVPGELDAVQKVMLVQ